MPGQPGVSSSDTQSNAGSEVASRRTKPTNGGRNQYNSNCPPTNCPKTEEALRNYQRRGITNAKTISQLLKEDHDMDISPATVKRRRKALELRAARGTTDHTAPEDLKGLVYKAYEGLIDERGRTFGPRALKKAIQRAEGVIVSRDYITAFMKDVDPDGFTRRWPIFHDTPQDSAWTIEYGFTSVFWYDLVIIRDIRSRKVLAWHLNSPALYCPPGLAALLLLHTVRKLEGMPMQATDYCPLLTVIFGILRHGRASESGSARHGILDNSISEILHDFRYSLTRYYRHAKFDAEMVQFLDDVVEPMMLGHGYGVKWDAERYLWLWLINLLVRNKLDAAFAHYNARMPQHPNLHDNLLEPVDLTRVEQLMQDIGGEDLLRYPNATYDREGRRILYELTGMQLEEVTEDVTEGGLKSVFDAMKPHAAHLFSLRSKR